MRNLRLAQLGKCVTLDLRARSPSLTLGVEIPEYKIR